MNHKLSALKPNPKNPRKMTDKKLEMLKKSLQEFGDLSGIVFNRRSQQIVGGHQRVKVLPGDAEIQIEREFAEPTRTGTIQMGSVAIDGESYSYREVDWNELKEKAANIAANQHGGEFDIPGLTEWLLDLDAHNFPMDLTGFDTSDLEKFFAPIHRLEPKAGDDETPETPAEPQSKLGDLYQLGDHLLLCGDSTFIDSIEKIMGSEKANLVFTDPPYNVMGHGF